MTYRIFSTLVLSAFLLALAAQPAAAQVELGLKGGVNLAKFSLDPEDDDVTFPYVYGPTGGIYITLGDGPVAAQIEALYSRKGSKAEAPLENQLFKLDYIDIPLLLRFNGATTNDTTIFATVGPTIGFNFRAQLEDSDGFEDDIKDDVEDIEYGLSFGIGVETSNVLLEGRYTHGLSDLVDPDEVGGGKLRHRTFTFLLGFGF